EDIAEVVSRWTHIPVSKLLEGEVQKLLQLEEELHKRVIDQDEAVLAVAEAVVRARSGLKDPNRPIGSFIFLGPTGVGKTELARALAEFLFDDERAMIRIDMSEYQEKHTVARLIGAPPGYVGYEEGGQLTEEVRGRFRPEFLNRIDEIIVFHRLSEEHLKRIVEIQLGRVRQRLADRHITLDLTEAAKEHLVRVGYDPAYGARPLKRALQKEIETALGRRLLQGDIRDGQTLVIDYDPVRGELTFTPQGSGAEAEAETAAAGSK